MTHAWIGVDGKSSGRTWRNILHYLWCDHYVFLGKWALDKLSLGLEFGTFAMQQHHSMKSQQWSVYTNQLEIRLSVARQFVNTVMVERYLVNQWRLPTIVFRTILAYRLRYFSSVKAIVNRIVNIVRDSQEWIRSSVKPIKLGLSKRVSCSTAKSRQTKLACRILECTECPLYSQ